MKAINFIILVIVLCTLFGCQKEQILTYTDSTSDRFIYFSRTEADSVDLSFFSYPGQTSILFPVVVKSSGYGDQNAGYKISVMNEYTTATPADYEIPASCIFRGQLFRDTCYVRFNYSPKLDASKVRIVLQLEDNENFLRGPLNARVAVIWLHNFAVQPSWWAGTITSYIMGPYTEKKYRTFMNAVGVDLTDADVSTIRHYAMVFKQYLAEQSPPILEDNGTVMTVLVGGN